MKRITFLTLLATMIAMYGFQNAEIKTKQIFPINYENLSNEPYYGYITIDGVYSDDKRAFVSKIIYYSGYESIARPLFTVL